MIFVLSTKYFLVWDIFTADIFPHISAQLTCDGTETFEKISGVNISSARLTPLYSEAGGTVTAQCNNRYEVTYKEEILYIPHHISSPL